MSDKFLVIKGRLDWAKLTGSARPYRGNPKFDKGPLWSVDITPDAESLKLLEDNDLERKLRKPNGPPKGKDTRTEKFVSLKVLENRTDGTKNQPPRLYDASNKPWTGGLIGNGSIGEVKVKVVEYDGAETGVYLQAVRILEHVPYEVKDFDDLPQEELPLARLPDGLEPFTGTDDLDDDVPF